MKDISSSSKAIFAYTKHFAKNLTLANYSLSVPLKGGLFKFRSGQDSSVDYEIWRPQKITFHTPTEHTLNGVEPLVNN
jgi:hypothetical protein